VDILNQNIVKLSPQEISCVSGSMSGDHKHKLSLRSVVCIGVVGVALAGTIYPHGLLISSGIFAARFLGAYFILGTPAEFALRKAVASEIVGVVIVSLAKLSTND